MNPKVFGENVVGEGLQHVLDLCEVIKTSVTSTVPSGKFLNCCLDFYFKMVLTLKKNITVKNL